MGEDLNIDCPECGCECIYMFDGDIDSVHNSDIDLKCESCGNIFKAEVVPLVGYELVEK